MKVSYYDITLKPINLDEQRWELSKVAVSGPPVNSESPQIITFTRQQYVDKHPKTAGRIFAILVHRFYFGVSTYEIAKELRITECRVWQLWRKGIRQIFALPSS